MKYLLILIMLVGFATAGIEGTIGLDLGAKSPTIVEGANYSINVNNTNHFEGYTVSSLYNYFKGLLETYFDGIYCKLTGCTMTGNINMNTS